MTNSIVLSFVLLFLLSTIVVPMHAHAVSPNEICQKTRNPSFCSNVLKSAATTDLKALATFTLNLAHTKATNSHLLAKSLASKATDHKLKERYTSCAKDYNGAAGNIDDAKNYLASGDFNGVNIKASAAMTEAGDCLDNFAQPPVDSSPLSKNVKALEDVCSIILVISNLLPAGV